jgi:hypothetical protein
MLSPRVPSATRTHWTLIEQASLLLERLGPVEIPSNTESTPPVDASSPPAPVPAPTPSPTAVPPASAPFQPPPQTLAAHQPAVRSTTGACTAGSAGEHRDERREEQEGEAPRPVKRRRDDTRPGVVPLPLLQPVLMGDEQLVRAVLARGAQVSEKNDDVPRTQNGHQDDKPADAIIFLRGLERLVDGPCGPQMDARDAHGHTALLWAASQGHEGGCAAPPCERGRPQRRQPPPLDPPISAAEAGHTRVCEILLNRGAAINAQTDYVSTALMAAALARWARARGGTAPGAGGG